MVQTKRRCSVSWWNVREEERESGGNTKSQRLVDVKRDGSNDEWRTKWSDGDADTVFGPEARWVLGGIHSAQAL